MRLYLSGKITGNEKYKADFAAGRARLEAAGFDVCDPTALGLPEDVGWEDAMRIDIREMLLCEGVAMLPNWNDSKGARIEVRLAGELGMPCKLIEGWVEVGVDANQGGSGK